MDMPEQIPAYEPQPFKLPFPGDFEDAKYEDIRQRAHAMCNAARAIFTAAHASGQTIPITEDDRETARQVFDGTLPAAVVQTTAEQLHLTALLTAYDINVVQSAQQIRNFCVNKLIEKAGTAPKDSDQLRAIEMLGKVKDVALFEERSTVLVQNMTTDQIATSLFDKIALMRNKAGAVSVTPRDPLPVMKDITPDPVAPESVVPKPIHEPPPEQAPVAAKPSGYGTRHGADHGVSEAQS